MTPGRGPNVSKRSQRRKGEFVLSTGTAFNPAAWLSGHAQSAVSSIGRLMRRPVATVATVLAIAVALSLPFALYVILDNAQRAVGGFDRSAQLTAFLRHDLGENQAAAVAAAVGRWDAVKRVRVVTRAEALSEYQRMTGFDDVRAIFEGHNPLPDLIVVTARDERSNRADLVALRERISARAEVDAVELDLVWVDRLAAILETLRRIVEVLFAMLGLGILLIVGNTIRLGIESRREEIGIVRLFGATDAFIRRPFLYSGLWYGLAAGGVACGLVAAATGLAAEPVQRLVALYASDFELIGLQPWSAAVAVAAGGLLGIAGAWIAVARVLAEESTPQ